MTGTFQSDTGGTSIPMLSMKRIDIATILNGKWEDDHKKKLKALKEFRERTLDKAINPELVIMQMNAIDNKNNGIIVSAYN